MQMFDLITTYSFHVHNLSFLKVLGADEIAAESGGYS